MEAISVVLAVLIGFFVIIAITSSDAPSERLAIAGTSARLTLEEVMQVNRIATLRILAPELAIELAARLQGDAWQVANASLCATLLQLGREDEALALHSRLDVHHRRQALEAMLSELVDASKADQAQQLLERIGTEQPSDPLLRISLQLADGKRDDATREMDILASADALDGLKLLKLAQLQRESGKPDAARRSLDKFWVSQHEAPEAIVGMETFVQELANLGDIQRLEQIAAAIDLPRHNPFIAPLIDAGRFDQARQQIDKLDSVWRTEHYEHLFDALLQHDQNQTAEELLASVDDITHVDLLCRLAQRQIDQGDVSEAEREIQRLARHDAQRVDLYLSLWHMYAKSQADMASSFLKQAERYVERLPAAQEHDQLRLVVLEARLTAQSQLPERQRTGYEVRRLLEEVQRITERQSSHDQALNLPRQARVLHQLDRPADAQVLLDKAHDCIQKASAQGEMDDYERDSQMDRLAVTYLQMGHVERALEISAQRTRDLSDFSDWLDALVDQGLLEQAVESASYADLFDTQAPILRLFNTLAESDSLDAGALTSALLDKLVSDAFWQWPPTQTET